MARRRYSSCAYGAFCVLALGCGPGERTAPADPEEPPAMRAPPGTEDATEQSLEAGEARGVLPNG